MTRILYCDHLINYSLEPLNALQGLGIGKSLQAIDNFGNILYDSFF